MTICWANFVPVKVRISYNFDLALSHCYVCLPFIPLEAWAERGKYFTKHGCGDLSNTVALIAEKCSPLTWLTSAGIKHMAKSSRGRFWRIKSLAVLILFLNTSSFLVNILFAYSKFSLTRRTLKADNSWSFAYIVKQSTHSRQQWNIVQPTSTRTRN